MIGNRLGGNGVSEPNETLARLAPRGFCDSALDLGLNVDHGGIPDRGWVAFTLD